MFTVNCARVAVDCLPVAVADQFDVWNPLGVAVDSPIRYKRERVSKEVKRVLLMLIAGCVRKEIIVPLISQSLENCACLLMLCMLAHIIALWADWHSRHVSVNGYRPEGST